MPDKAYNQAYLKVWSYASTSKEFHVLVPMLSHLSLSASTSSPVSASSERNPSSQQPTRRHSDRHQGDPGVPPGLRHRSMSDSRGSPRGEIIRLVWGSGRGHKQVILSVRKTHFCRKNVPFKIKENLE